MMTRMLVFAAVMAVVLGRDVGKAQPTLYAPGDLASVIPSGIGEVDLEVEGPGGSNLLAEALGQGALDRILETDQGIGYHAEMVRFEDPPDDRWLSIAETIELLPAEE